MIEAHYTVIDELLFLVGRHPWNAQLGDNDRTIAATRSCPDPDGKLASIEDDWPNEIAQRNVGLDLCAGDNMSYCFVVDADEVYDTTSLKRMIEYACSRLSVGASHISNVRIGGRIDTASIPSSHFTVPTFVRVGTAKFVRSRHTDALVVARFSPGVPVCHHLSDARTDEQMQNKITRFSTPISYRGWFDQVLRKSNDDPQMENRHPISPAAYKRAVLQDPRRYPPRPFVSCISSRGHNLWTTMRVTSYRAAIQLETRSASNTV